MVSAQSTLFFFVSLSLSPTLSNLSCEAVSGREEQEGETEYEEEQKHSGPWSEFLIHHWLWIPLQRPALCSTSKRTVAAECVGKHV